MHLRDFQVQTPFDAAYQNSTFKLHGTVQNVGQQKCVRHSVEAKLLDADGKPVFSHANKLSVAAGKEPKLRSAAAGQEPEEMVGGDLLISTS